MIMIPRRSGAHSLLLGLTIGVATLVAVPVAAQTVVATPGPLTERARDALGQYRRAAASCDRAATSRISAELDRLMADANAALRAAQSAGQFAAAGAVERAEREVRGVRDAIVQAGQVPVCPPQDETMLGAPEGEQIDQQPMQPLPPGTPYTPVPVQPPPIGEPSPPARPIDAARAAAARHAEAADRCDLAAMSRELDQLAGSLSDARLQWQAARAAGVQYVDLSRVQLLQRDLEEAERLYRTAIARRARNCPPGRDAAQPIPSENVSSSAPSGAGSGNWSFGLYFGAGYDHLFEEGVSIGMASVTAGYRFHPNAGVEAQGFIGVVDESDDSGSVRTSLGVNHAVVGYVVGYLPLSGGTDLFARLGYGTAEFGTEIRSGSTSTSGKASDDFFAWGGGVQHFFDGSNGVRASYTRWEFDGGASNVVGVSFVHRLGGRR